MDGMTIQLISMIVHLAEYVETGEQADLIAARGMLQVPDVEKALKPGALVPVTRSGKSVAEILGG